MSTTELKPPSPEALKGMNVYQRINACRTTIPYIQKDKEVDAGNSRTYMAVTHDQVTAQVRASLINFGIVIVPTLVSSTYYDREVIDGKAKAQRMYAAQFDISFVNIDDPKDLVTLRAEAHALDSGDKSPGKAVSYATKTVILKVFNIETGEDDESRTAVDFDLEDLLTQMADATSNDALRPLYEAGMAAVTKLRDREGEKRIVSMASTMRRKFSTAAREEQSQTTKKGQAK